MVCMKKEHIFLIILLLCTFLIRIYNANELSGGDDSQFAQLSAFAIKSPAKIIYPSFSDEPMSWGGLHYTRPFAVIPLVISILIFGYNKYAVLMPTLLFSVLSVLLLYLIVKKQFNTKTAFVASILFAFSPFHIAFTRSGFLHGALTFYFLLATFLVIKAIDERKNLFIYLAAFVCLANAWTTDFRGLIPLSALLPYLYFRKVKKEQIKHFFFAAFIVLGLFFIYMLIPLIFFKNPEFINSFISMFLYALPGHGAVMAGSGISILGSAKTMLNYLVMTPFMGLIFIPVLFGFLYSLKNIKKPKYALWLFWFLSIIIFYIHGKPYVERQVVIVPAFAVLASIGITHSLDFFVKEKKGLAFASLIALTISWIVLLAARFPITYASEYMSITKTNYFLSLIFGFLNNYYIWIIIFILLLTMLISHFYFRNINIKRQKNVLSIIVIIYLLLNFSVASALVIGGFGIYKRPNEVKVVADYIKNNLQDEKYACVAGIHDKSFIFYTQRVCASWLFINVSWIEQQVENNNLKYFVLNTYLYDGYTPGFGRIDQSDVVDNTSCTQPGEWHCNEPEKYNWLIKNTVDITYKTGLKPDNPYFRLYEYNK